MCTERSILFVALAAATMVSIAPVASAADDRELAKTHFQRGSQLFAAGRFAAARLEFETAYRILPDVRVLANTAACFVAERRPVEALRRYRRFLSTGGDQIPSPVRRRTEREMRYLRRAAGDMALSVEPLGAEIRIDGQLIGTAPLPWPVAVRPGPRRIEVKAPGHGSLTRTIQVDLDQEVAVTIVLAPRGSGDDAAASAEYGNGGTFRVSTSRTSHTRRRSPRTPLLWTGVGVTAALAVGASITGLLTLRNEAEYDRPGTSIDRRRDLYDETRTLSVVTDILIDAGVVTGLATLGYYFLGKPDTDLERPVASALHLSPRFAKGGVRCDLSLVF